MKTAAELNITNEEWTALQAVAAGLASGEYVHGGYEGKKIFDMGIQCMSRDCGTVACIGGWTGREMGMTINESDEYVGSCVNELNCLYYPDVAWHHITPAIASDAIYNFLDTGHPDFEALLAAQEDANNLAKAA